MVVGLTFEATSNSKQECRWRCYSCTSRERQGRNGDGYSKARIWLDGNFCYMQKWQSPYPGWLKESMFKWFLLLLFSFRSLLLWINFCIFIFLGFSIEGTCYYCISIWWKCRSGSFRSQCCSATSGLLASLQ